MKNKLLLIICLFNCWKLHSKAQENQSCLNMTEGYLISCSKVSNKISNTENFYLGDIVFYESMPNINHNTSVDSILISGQLVQNHPYISKYSTSSKNNLQKDYLKLSIVKELLLNDSSKVVVRKIILVYNFKNEKMQEYLKAQRGYNSASFLSKKEKSTDIELKIIYPELIISNMAN